MLFQTFKPFIKLVFKKHPQTNYPLPNYVLHRFTNSIDMLTPSVFQYSSTLNEKKEVEDYQDRVRKQFVTHKMMRKCLDTPSEGDTRLSRSIVSRFNDLDRLGTTCNWETSQSSCCECKVNSLWLSTGV